MKEFIITVIGIMLLFLVIPVIIILFAKYITLVYFLINPL